MNASKSSFTNSMRTNTAGKSFWLPAGLTLLLAVSCFPPRSKLDLPFSEVAVTEPLYEHLDDNPRFVVGEIGVDIDQELEGDDTPTTEELDQLKAYIHWQMNHTYLFEVVGPGAADVRYRIRGKVTRFRRGDYTARVLGVSRHRDNYLVADLEIVDLLTGGITFAGIFKSELTHGEEKTEKLFDLIAESFAGELRRQYLQMMREETEEES